MEQRRHSQLHELYPGGKASDVEMQSSPIHTPHPPPPPPEDNSTKSASIPPSGGKSSKHADDKLCPVASAAAEYYDLGDHYTHRIPSIYTEKPKIEKPNLSMSQKFFERMMSTGEQQKPPDAPDNISVELWKKPEKKATDYYNEGQGSKRDAVKVLRDIANFANEFQPPHGFGDAKLWEIIVEGALASMTEKERINHNMFCKNVHARFLAAEDSDAKPQFCDSRVVNFFVDLYTTDFNVDAAVNAFALVNALSKLSSS